MVDFVVKLLKFLLAYSILAAVCLIAFERGALKERFSDVPVVDAQRKQIVETVALFNKILTDFYATGGDPSLIDEMQASKNVKHFIYRDIGFLGNRGMILVLDQASSQLVGLVKEGDNLRATFFEEWNYMYQEFDTRKPVSDIKGMGENYTYLLTRKNDKWQIESWELEELPELPPKNKEFLY